MQVSFAILQWMEAVKKGCILLQWLSAVRCISHKHTLLCRQVLERYSKGGGAALSASAACWKDSGIWRTMHLTEFFALVCSYSVTCSPNSSIPIQFVYKRAIMNVQNNCFGNIVDILVHKHSIKFCTLGFKILFLLIKNAHRHCSKLLSQQNKQCCHGYFLYQEIFRPSDIFGKPFIQGIMNLYSLVFFISEFTLWSLPGWSRFCCSVQCFPQLLRQCCHADFCVTLWRNIQYDCLGIII